MKTGICNEIFSSWTIEKTIEYVGKIGYDGLEIAPFTLANSVEDISTQKRSEIRTLAEKHRIEIIGTHWLLVKPEGLSISSPCAELRKKTSHYFEQLVQFTSDIGGKIMVLGSPKQRSIKAGQTKQEVIEYFKEVIRMPLEMAKQKHITICLEPLAKTETNFVNTVTEALEIIKEVNHLNLRLILDVKAMCDENRPFSEIIFEGKDYLSHFHANDRNLLGPGSGDIDFGPIIKALKEISYQGFISVEVFDFSPGPEHIAEKSIQYLKKFL
ncbi:MAG TPA: sugar phosphate isomerase/epimerase family protein [bacterium]|nr:sugar phosphate isomerase/epimerase family protein [bacterium]HOL35450.1 sugar phosphate isomerase/epimerase family protein [bacterium]HPP08928.1 sugar phosphate isomerase/epimerase family protein [bacterium]